MKKAALIFGIIFIVIAILGFIPNPIVGPGALFETDAVHNIVHLIFGLILVFVAVKSPAKAAAILKIVGVIYLIVALLGFFTGSFIGLFHVNPADNWLHLALAIVIGGAGFLGGKSNTVAAPEAPSTPMGGQM